MKITTVTAANFEAVLPLIADYQRFYDAEPDEERNRVHFSRFLSEHREGILFLAKNENGEALGFATIYLTFSSVRACQECLMNDLYVMPETRGQGVGRALIDHCAAYAKFQGFASIHWRTAPSNHTAQRLYNSTGAVQEEWYEYVLPV